MGQEEPRALVANGPDTGYWTHTRTANGGLGRGHDSGSTEGVHSMIHLTRCQVSSRCEGQWGRNEASYVHQRCQVIDNSAESSDGDGKLCMLEDDDRFGSATEVYHEEEGLGGKNGYAWS